MIDEGKKLIGIVSVEVGMDQAAEFDFLSRGEEPFQDGFRADTTADNKRINGENRDEKQEEADHR